MFCLGEGLLPEGKRDGGGESIVKNNVIEGNKVEENDKTLCQHCKIIIWYISFGKGFLSGNRNCLFSLLHSEWPKLYRVLAFLSAMELNLNGKRMINFNLYDRHAFFSCIHENFRGWVGSMRE